MKRTIFSALAGLLAATVILTGCGGAAEPAGEPDYAGPIVESALRSISNGDYDTYVSQFDGESRQFLTETNFQQTRDFINGKIGDYVSKDYVEEKIEGGYTVQYYEAEYTGEDGPVSVKAVFTEEDGEMKLAGFWLSSPKLQSQ